MSTILRAPGWEYAEKQRFVAIPPLGDEVVVYETSSDPESLERAASRSGFENIQCVASGRHALGATAVGQNNGVVCVFDAMDPKLAITRLQPKQSRPCNTVAFGANGLVAAGFDKGRQDNSLQVWDAARASSDSRPVHAHVANEAILLLLFLDETVVAGSYKFLRQFDLRSDQPAFQVATKCTLGLVADPLQSHYFLLYGDDGLVAVWDRRRLGKHKANAATGAEPVLHFPKLLADGSRKGSPCLRYSPVRRGEFSLVFAGNVIRRWHTGVAPQSRETAAQARRLSSSGRNAVVGLKQQAAQLYRPGADSLFVLFVLDAKTSYERVVLFDYLPDPAVPGNTHFACMRQLGLVFRMSARECIDSLVFNLYNEITVAGPEGLGTQFCEPAAPPPRKRRISRGAGDMLSDSDESESESEAGPVLSVRDILDLDVCSRMRQRAAAGYGLDPDTNVELLGELGGIDSLHFLRNTWRWLALAHRSLNKGTMVSQGVDLGYQGVLLWNGADDLRGQRRWQGEKDEPGERGTGDAQAGLVSSLQSSISGHSNNQSGASNLSRSGLALSDLSLSDKPSLTEERLAQAVKAIVAAKGRKTSGISISSSSEKRVQRKLCLIILGWYLTDDELDDKLDSLAEMGLHEKAAGWAVFHGKVSRAVEILAASKKERLRLVSTAVAGYLAYKDVSINSPWKDQCRRMALEMDNPYLRAIFAFVADSDWSDVLDEHLLPLRERLGVALRYLSDRDLAIYLNRIADHVVARGELEGLVLTGVTPRGIDLLQNYVNRTSDVQTAALISLFAVPRYFSDTRADHWLDCYRTLLNSWGMHSTRARFDVGRTRLSKGFNGRVWAAPSPKQVFLQCLKCNKNIGVPPVDKGKDAALLHFHQRRRGDDSVCPHCRAPLPRCAVCLLTLGTSVPVDLAASEERDKNQVRFRDWFSFCMTCNHGAHAVHAEEWFSKHYVCPVPDCACRCNSK